MNTSRPSHTEDAMRLVIAFNEAFDRHDVPAMMAVMSDDCRFEDTNPPPDGAVYEGKEVVTRHWERFFAGSPRARFTVEEMVGMDDRCVVRWRYEWVDEAGQPGHVRGIDLFKARDGLLVEKLSYVKG